MSTEARSDEEARATAEGAIPKALSVLEALVRARSPVRLTARANELRIQKWIRRSMPLAVRLHGRH